MESQIILNKSLDLVEPSRSVTLLAKVRRMQAADPGILNLTGGEPDFDTPEAICLEAWKQLRNGCTHYADSKGDPQLRSGIARKLAEENNAPYSPDNILITPGAKYAIYLAIQALINPGDEVMWLTPGWVSYPAIVTLCGGTAVAVHLEEKDHYTLSFDRLEEKVSDKTRLLIINYPNNPTGKILSEKEMDDLRKFLRKHPDIYCLSDEIYEKIIFDGKAFISAASDPEFFERIILVNGFSKCSAMTGWRIGYLACNPSLYSAALKIFQHSMSCVSSFIQKAAVTALHLPGETERMRSAYEHRRNIIYEGLRDVPGISFNKPEGSFYAWIRFQTDMDSEQLCNRLLEEAGIGGIPGSAYGEENGCYARFCFASDDSILKEFVSRIRSFRLY